MRTLIALIAIAAVLAPAAVGTDAPAGFVTANLEVDVVGYPYKACTLVVPEGSNVADLLDEAERTGCIEEWSAEEYPGYGRYVASIDFVPGAFATYWAFYVDGGYADAGIDGTPVQDHGTYAFNYEQWVVPA